jgi:hypothetical protein
LGRLLNQEDAMFVEDGDTFWARGIEWRAIEDSDGFEVHAVPVEDPLSYGVELLQVGEEEG